MDYGLWNFPANTDPNLVKCRQEMGQGKNCSKQDIDQVVALSMMDVKGMDEDTVTWVRAIEALPVVSLLSLLTKKSGFRVTLTCYESCGDKRCGPVCISKTCTTLLAAASPTDHGSSRREVCCCRPSCRCCLIKRCGGWCVSVGRRCFQRNGFDDAAQECQGCSGMSRLALWPPTRSHSRPSRQRTLWRERFRFWSER